LNVGLGGRGKVLKSPGLGVNVKNERLQKFISSETLSNLQPPLVAERTV
jgi:hypothetical protein